MKKSLFSAILLVASVLGCSPSPYADFRNPHLVDVSASTKAGTLPIAARIEQTLQRELVGRRLSSEVNAAWQIMHGVVPYGAAIEIETPDRGLVSAIEYAFSGGAINGFEIGLGDTLLASTGRYGVVARLEPGSYVGQGHPDQWLAIFAMADLPLETQVQIGAEQATLLDWARQAQWDVTNNLLDEYSWTLIALTHFFPDEPTWKAANGDTISWEMLVEAELTYDINSSACGGTHRLAGIVRAVHAKERLGLTNTPTWQKATEVIADSLRKAKEFRGADNALSCNYFVRPGNTVDLAADLSSSGHLFEFIALAASDEELRSDWVSAAAARICELLEVSQGVELDCGALYHALNGLRIYADRVDGETKGT